MEIDSKLITKYNTAVPRYTSYPTVPHWQAQSPTESQWLSSIKKAYDNEPGISLYIHLPFCEALCTYCGCNKRITKNHSVEKTYIDAVLKEWSIYKAQFEDKPIIREIHLGGGTPTFFSPEELERMLSIILDDCTVSDTYEFSFEAHPNSTTIDHLTVLYNLGFRRISIGVQDVSQAILKAINRFQSSQEIRLLTNWAREIGYTSVNYDIIYGLPFQKSKHVRDTIAFVSELKPDRIAFYSYAHVPWKSASQRAFTIDDVPTGIQKSNLYKLGRKLLESVGYEAVGMDHFCIAEEALNTSYKCGTMHRNFMGYTSNYTQCCIALGASSIGDSWEMYVQNEKHVETYQDIVNNGRLPIIKGHQLTTTELVIRKHILNLMCKDGTSWNDNSIDAITITPFLPNLDQLVEDGLVSYSSNHIEVKGIGRYFIRNICASIDPLFQNFRSEAPIFSKAI